MRCSSAASRCCRNSVPRSCSTQSPTPTAVGYFACTQRRRDLPHPVRSRRRRRRQNRSDSGPALSYYMREPTVHRPACGDPGEGLSGGRRGRLRDRKPGDARAVRGRGRREPARSPGCARPTAWDDADAARFRTDRLRRGLLLLRFQRRHHRGPPATGAPAAEDRGDGRAPLDAAGRRDQRRAPDQPHSDVAAWVSGQRRPPRPRRPAALRPPG